MQQGHCGVHQEHRQVGTCPLPLGLFLVVSPINIISGKGGIPQYPREKPLSPCGHVPGGVEGLFLLRHSPLARLQGGFVALTGIPVLPAVP